MQILMLVALIFFVSLATATPEGTERARAKIKQWEPLMLAVTILIWFVLLYPWGE